MSKNKLGIVSIDLGAFEIPDNHNVANLIPNETKQILDDLLQETKNRHQGEYQDMGVNDITKILYVHFVDLGGWRDIRAIGSIETDDDGPYFYRLSFMSGNYNYQLNISDTGISMVCIQFQYVE